MVQSKGNIGLLHKINLGKSFSGLASQCSLILELKQTQSVCSKQRGKFSHLPVFREVTEKAELSLEVGLNKFMFLVRQPTKNYSSTVYY